jgi:methyltransferase (TIGR00027 family)
MLDAESSNPVCGDNYAKTFMNEDGLRILEAFKDETSPNASTISRHRIIDDLLREELLSNPNLCVVMVGAGFDSRAFRLKGGTWLELDEPQIIEYKNGRLPTANSDNELHRIPIDFSTDSLEDKLLPYSKYSPVVIVIEGVFAYLEEEEVRQLLNKLRRIYPQHKLICDLTSRAFFEEYSQSLHEKFAGLGASFKFTAEEPEKIFIENGYSCAERISIVERAVEYELINIPMNILRTTLHTLAEGYAVYVFDNVINDPF